MCISLPYTHKSTSKSSHFFPYVASSPPPNTYINRKSNIILPKSKTNRHHRSARFKRPSKQHHSTVGQHVVKMDDAWDEESSKGRRWWEGKGLIDFLGLGWCLEWSAGLELISLCIEYFKAKNNTIIRYLINRFNQQGPSPFLQFHFFCRKTAESHPGGGRPMKCCPEGINEGVLSCLHFG